jgi:UDP-N-acetylglucosamine--N-acetylmuramyl-(pentapeptide) pyrophosphoryl-undecaprenol N-acetylglucosamine transferase
MIVMTGMEVKNISRDKVVIAAGGTGGHVFPALAIADELVERGVAPKNIYFFGSRHSLEKKVVPGHGYRLICLPGKGLNRGEPIKNAVHICSLAFSCVLAFFLMVRIRPKVVIGTGGYGAVPAFFAATLLFRGRVVHEQNSVLTRTNKFACRLGAQLLTTFEETRGGEKATRVGLPLANNVVDAIGLRKEFISHSHRPTITISGGSLGSRIINDAVMEMVKTHDISFDLNHICGHKDFERCREAYGVTNDNIHILELSNDVASLYGTSDVVVARAGAGTCIELETLGVPSIFIPLPSAPGNHQLLNAQAVARSTGGYVLEQKDLSADVLYQHISQVLTTSANAGEVSNSYHLDARNRIGDFLEKFFS